MQESLNDVLNDAKEELKRVEHMIFVSLKYTRTVDVFQNIISRMVDCYDYLLEVILIKALDDKKIAAMPDSPIERGELLKQNFEDDEVIKDNVNLYFLLRKLMRTNNPQKEQEFRRHVTMISYVDGRKEIINIDIITEYYHFQKKFFEYIDKVLINPEEK